MNSSPNWQLGAWDDAGGCGPALQCQAAASRFGWRGRGLTRLDPTIVIRRAPRYCAKPVGTPPLLRLERFQSRGASQCRSPGRPPSSSGSSSSPPARAPAAGSKRQAGAPPPPCPPPRLALSRLTFRSPTRGGAQGRSRGGELGCAHYPIPSPRSAPERIGPCPGLGTEAVPRRDGWALGFWVR